MQQYRRHRVADLPTLHRIAWFCLSQSQEPLPEVEVDDSFRQRPAYQEGCMTDEPDLSRYDAPPGEAQSVEPANETPPTSPRAGEQHDDTNPSESEDDHG